jgi:hypothetical protein
MIVLPLVLSCLALIAAAGAVWYCRHLAADVVARLNELNAEPKEPAASPLPTGRAYSTEALDQARDALARRR